MATVPNGVYGNHNPSAFSPAINDMTMYSDLAGTPINGLPLENGSGDASYTLAYRRHENNCEITHRPLESQNGESMEMEDAEGICTASPSVVDVTTTGDIIVNRRSVGGRKRVREDDEEDFSIKKLRKEGQWKVTFYKAIGESN